MRVYIIIQDATKPTRVVVPGGQQAYLDQVWDGGHGQPHQLPQALVEPLVRPLSETINDHFYSPPKIYKSSYKNRDS